jgi:hypothetical protein
MPERTFPNVGLKGGYLENEDGWGDSMNLNLLALSVLTQGTALDKVAATPGSPAAGDIYIFDETHATHANAVAVFEGPVGEEVWSYIDPQPGWLLYNQAEDYYEKFDGTVWAELATGGGGAAFPDFTGHAGEYLRVNATEDDVEWAAPSGGSVWAWHLEWSPIDNEPPTANYATLDTRNSRPVLDFDTTTQEAAIFTGIMPSDYAGGGVTISLWCALSTATSGTVGWDVAFERTQVATDDIDSDSFATAQTVTAVTVPGTSGHVLKMTINVSDGANMDSIAAGELFRLRVRRDVTNDTAAGDAELLRVAMVEQ